MPEWKEALAVPAFGLGFMLLVGAIAYGLRLDLTREIAVGTIRTFLQLMAAGAVLSWLFRARSPAWLLLPLGAMLGVAAWTAWKKAGRRPGAFFRIALALTLAEAVAMGLFFGLRIVPARPETIVPMSGMIVGNAMIVAGLFYDRLLAGRREREEVLILWLSLGADRRQAYREIAQEAVRAAMLPSLDTLKTVGIVQLPGMMTGMIVAGASPLAAVGYQILIMYAIAGGAAVTAATLYVLSVPLVFTSAHQLRR
ncbi:MAG: iron export ABC transporter permease subunit FetB [Hydrogenibacillus schlegelii]|uniref:Iron export ABC transporter permease subunit FetB n=1 Tax=Hydrogenibacillus schlegelii TaxID=1484 RepID=A0A947CXK8_HYDSH|nr:iron export ABC transporter permease subunit FetB [Hydrogenibacillus schlegelii]